VKGSGTEHKKRYKGGPTCKKVFLNNYIFKSQMFFNGKEQRGAERSGSERCGAEQNTKRDTREDQHAKRCFSIITSSSPKCFQRKGAKGSGKERCGTERKKDKKENRDRGKRGKEGGRRERNGMAKSCHSIVFRVTRCFS
jgi:hypothetical protein